MILHHQFYFLLIIVINVHLSFCESKAKSFFNDDSSEYKDDYQSSFQKKPLKDAWSIDFPKNDAYSSKLDSSYEDNSYENKNDDNYYKKPNDHSPSFKPYNTQKSQAKPYKNKFNSKLPNENEEEEDLSYDHHDYSNNYNSDDYKNPKPALNYDDSYATSKKPVNHNSYVDNNKSPNNDKNNGKYDSNYAVTKKPPPASYQDATKYDTKYDDKYSINNKYENRPSTQDNDYNKYNNNYDNGNNNDNKYGNKHEDKYENKPQSKPYNSNYKLTCYDREFACIPLLKCPINRFDDYDSIQKCALTDGSDGICCPPAELPTPRGRLPNYLPISKKATKKVYPKKLNYFADANKNQYRSLNDNYDERVKYVKQIERALMSRKLTSSKNSPEMAHHNFFGYNKEVVSLGRKGESSISKAIEIARNFVSSFQPTKTLSELFTSHSTNVNMNATECPRDPICSTISKYRTPDGSCNNKFYPSYGKSFSPYNRVLSPDYGDGINSPRLSKAKEELPNVRKLSVELTKHKYPPLSRLSLTAMQFGQFIDHDIASAAPTRTDQGTPISCCRPEIQADPANLKHPACFEITISKEDSFYSEFNLTCMNFVRSVATQRADCKLAPREQLNQPTSFIDASQIYGSSIETQMNLRALNGGQLLSSLINNYQFLPRQTNGTCNVPGNDPKQCFLAGDPRSNENIDLTVMQTVFLREHNRVARELQDINPDWNDETLYQETKAIISAVIQHITYSEFLPAVLNRQTMKQFNLYPNEEGYSNKYDPKINPTLFNSFATAGYRWHSTIQGSLQLRNNKDEIIGEIPLSSTFNNPTILTKPGILDGLIYGMTSQSMQELDQYFTSEVTNKLFRPWNSTFGLDIFALNVARGRDHGLKGYPSWLKQCGLEKIKHFDDLDMVMPKKLVNILKRFYSSVYDIDLYIAGIIENHLPNSELGPLFSCLAAEQFRRLKFGDRFWYENSGQIHSFTPDQLAEIKKVSMARIFCDNGDYVDSMQPLTFILPKYWWNKKVSCNSELIPKMCFLPWTKK